MADFNVSPNMALPIPSVGTEAGPDYAINVNNSLTLIDQHNHTPGYGVQIPVSGLSINGDLPMNGNNVISIRAARFNTQSNPLTGTAPDLNEIYVSGVDLYYNDGNGNQVRITQSGGVAGSPGSISNLTSPASASYVSANKTFVWESDASTAANMDMGSIILRDITASSNGITISPPNSLSSNYTLTLPTSLPGSTSVLTVSPSGTTSTITYDGIGQAMTSTGADAIAATRTRDVTTGSTGAVGAIVYSSSSGNYSTTSTTFTPITNQAVTLTVSSRPVQINFRPEIFTDSSHSSFMGQADTGAGFQIQILRNGDVIALYGYEIAVAAGGLIPVSSISCLDMTPQVGTNVYQAQIKILATGTAFFKYAIMTAYEI